MSSLCRFKGFVSGFKQCDMRFMAPNNYEKHVEKLVYTDEQGKVAWDALLWFAFLISYSCSQGAS
jgi:hypothetical protein